MKAYFEYYIALHCILGMSVGVNLYLNSSLFPFGILSFQTNEWNHVGCGCFFREKKPIPSSTCVKSPFQSVHYGMRFKNAVLRSPPIKTTKSLLNSSLFPSDRPPVTSIPPGRLTSPNDLHHLPFPQPQILRHGIPHLDPRQLALLQAISLQQLHLLLRTQKLMRRHQLMMRNIDQQILLLEGLDDGGENDGDDLERGGGDRGLCDEDAGLEFVLVDVLGEGAHLLYAYARVRGEFDPDGADLGLRGGFGFRGYGGVFCKHGVGGFEGGVHLLAAGWCVSLVLLAHGAFGQVDVGGQTQAHRWGQRSFCENHREIS